MASLKKLLYDFLCKLEKEADVSQLNGYSSYEYDSDSNDVVLATASLKKCQVLQNNNLKKT